MVGKKGNIQVISPMKRIRGGYFKEDIDESHISPFNSNICSRMIRCRKQGVCAKRVGEIGENLRREIKPVF